TSSPQPQASRAPRRAGAARTGDPARESGLRLGLRDSAAARLGKDRQEANMWEGNMGSTAVQEQVYGVEDVRDEELFRRWQQGRDEHARELLVERYMPLARKLARRYRQSSVPPEDLIQVASLALVKAIDRYDTSRGAFASYALPTILG